MQLLIVDVLLLSRVTHRAVLVLNGDVHLHLHRQVSLGVPVNLVMQVIHLSRHTVVEVLGLFGHREGLSYKYVLYTIAQQIDETG